MNAAEAFWKREGIILQTQSELQLEKKSEN